MSEVKQVIVGGSFAPKLTAGEVHAMSPLFSECDAEVKDVVGILSRCVLTFLETPESRLPGMPHPSGVASVVPLEEDEKRRIFDVVPWSWECDTYGRVLDRLPLGNARNAAYHLLWYARELTVDREPITVDRIVREVTDKVRRS